MPGTPRTPAARVQPPLFLRNLGGIPTFEGPGANTGWLAGDPVLHAAVRPASTDRLTPIDQTDHYVGGDSS
jgi:hypothetical protein